MHREEAWSRGRHTDSADPSGVLHAKLSLSNLQFIRHGQGRKKKLEGEGEEEEGVGENLSKVVNSKVPPYAMENPKLHYL